MMSERVGVGMNITKHPHHGSRRAELPHRALASGHDGEAFGFSMRTAAPSSAAVGHGISRFPHEVLRCMCRVSDRAGLPRYSRCRIEKCGLPQPPTGSAPGSGSYFSRLNTGPAPSPVNASTPSLRPTSHDSGLLWVANPSILITFISNTSPVLTGAQEAV
jgi:hypothetical protein